MPVFGLLEETGFRKNAAPVTIIIHTNQCIKGKEHKNKKIKKTVYTDEDSEYVNGAVGSMQKFSLFYSENNLSVLSSDKSQETSSPAGQSETQTRKM